MADIDEEKCLVVEDLLVGKFEGVEGADRRELQRADVTAVCSIAVPISVTCARGNPPTR